MPIDFIRYDCECIQMRFDFHVFSRSNCHVYGHVYFIKWHAIISNRKSAVISNQYESMTNTSTWKFYRLISIFFHSFSYFWCLENPFRIMNMNELKTNFSFILHVRWTFIARLSIITIKKITYHIKRMWFNERQRIKTTM